MPRYAGELGAMAMMGGSTRALPAHAAWPSGEFGGIRQEGSDPARPRKELTSVKGPAKRA
ncbi:hypothetical protein ACH4HG_23600 [Streptomyces coeruleorubidus]|uniref:Uncharacterized protein n=1 Tax=Streptomyces coeruleorubidus TaxID=116188 RepID=A0ABZ0KKR0_STRC4|nr:hypothetical protein [Streptomyces coeruleorubidus]WOT38619.1 hypothetical protein R5U08_32665 [Streptomyces coeruleorubidus]